MTTYTLKSAESKLASLNGWSFSENSLLKNFTFKNFQETIAFMVRVSFLCEQRNHHPDWRNVYNKLTIKFSTHDAGGVTDKDFELAEAIDNLKIS